MYDLQWYFMILIIFQDIENIFLKIAFIDLKRSLVIYKLSLNEQFNTLK